MPKIFFFGSSQCLFLSVFKIRGGGNKKDPGAADVFFQMHFSCCLTHFLCN